MQTVNKGFLSVIHSSNVRPFRRPEPNSTFPERLLGAGFYIGLGLVLMYNPQFEGSVLFFALFGAVYFFLVKKEILKIKISYFFRYHYLQSLILFFFASLALMLLAKVFAFLLAAALMLNLGESATPLFESLFTGLSMLQRYGMLFIGLSQGMIALMGRTHRIPHITPHVIYWV